MLCRIFAHKSNALLTRQTTLAVNACISILCKRFLCFKNKKTVAFYSCNSFLQYFSVGCQPLSCRSSTATARRSSSSFSHNSGTFVHAFMIVAWLRPKALPICGKLLSVSFLARYIATIRGSAILLGRLLLSRSLIRKLKYSATRF